MSKQQRYTEEFKLAAVKQVTERHYLVAEVAERLGVSSHSLYAWIKRYSQPDVQQHESSQQAEIRRLKASMSRRGNCHDNAVAESFSQLLKRERIRRKTYVDREEARQDVFDYIEMFYNPKRRHSFNNGLSPVECEKQYFERLKSV